MFQVINNYSLVPFLKLIFSIINGSVSKLFRIFQNFLCRNNFFNNTLKLISSLQSGHEIRKITEKELQRKF